MNLKLTILLFSIWLSACSLNEQPAADTIPNATNSPPVSQMGTHPIENITSIDVEPTRTGCTVRNDWSIYTIRRLDTFADIAAKGGLTVDELVAANCMVDANQAYVFQEVRVPPAFPPTATAAPTTAPEYARVGLSPYVALENNRYQLEPGSTVSLGFEPNLPADITRIEFYLTGADDAKTLIAVDNNGGDNVWIDWTVPNELSGQLSAIAYNDGGIWAETTDPLHVFTTP